MTTVVNGKQKALHREDVQITNMASNSTVTPFTHYGSSDITGIVAAYRPLSCIVIAGSTGQRAIATIRDHTLYVYGTSTENLTVRLLCEPLH